MVEHQLRYCESCPQLTNVHSDFGNYISQFAYFITIMAHCVLYKRLKKHEDIYLCKGTKIDLHRYKKGNSLNLPILAQVLKRIQANLKKTFQFFNIQFRHGSEKAFLFL